MEIYIKGAGIVSPQETFARDGLPDEIIEYREADYLRCIEPPYREFIDPMASRRMSRIVKMGVCAAKMCLQDSGIEMPDAIITGTGLGCIEDTERFTPRPSEQKKAPVTGGSIRLRILKEKRKGANKCLSSVSYRGFDPIEDTERD